MDTEKIYENEHEKTEMLFIIRPTNEEQNDFIITVGRHLATEEHFKTRGEARAYIERPKWDTVLALISEIIQIHENSKHKEDGKNDQ